MITYITSFVSKIMRGEFADCPLRASGRVSDINTPSQSAQSRMKGEGMRSLIILLVLGVHVCTPSVLGACPMWTEILRWVPWRLNRWSLLWWATSFLWCLVEKMGGEKEFAPSVLAVGQRNQGFEFRVTVNRPNGFEIATRMHTLRKPKRQNSSENVEIRCCSR